MVALAAMTGAGAERVGRDAETQPTVNSDGRP